MMEQEIITDISDPRFIELHGVKGQTFYIQIRNMDVLTDKPLIRRGKGGMLCEDLGEV